MDEFSVKVTRKRASTNIELIGRMTIDQATTLKTALLAAFDRGKDVHIIMEKVIEADLSGLQVLCSAHRRSISLNRGFSVSAKDNEVIGAAARSAGLLRTVGCVRDVSKTCIWTEWSQ